GGVYTRGLYVLISTIFFHRRHKYHRQFPQGSGYAYPNVTNISIFVFVSSSTYSGGSAKVTFSPCNSATFPVNEESSTNCSTALTAVDIGVRIIALNKSEL